MTNIKEQIYNLVYNSILNEKISEKISKKFVFERVKSMAPEEIKELALKELKVIEELVELELPESKYWKEKEKRLVFIIWIQNKKIQKYKNVMRCSTSVKIYGNGKI